MQTNNNSFPEQTRSSYGGIGDAGQDKFNQSIPPLGVDTSRAVNKKGLVFIGIIGLVGLSVAYWLLTKSGDANKAAITKVEKEEVVVIPERKNQPASLKPAVKSGSMPLVSDVKTSDVAKPAVPADASSAIGVIGGPAVSSTTDPKVLTLDQRRAMGTLSAQPDVVVGKSKNDIPLLDESSALIRRRSSEGGNVSYAASVAAAATAAEDAKVASNKSTNPADMMANMMSALTGGGSAANKKPVEKPTNIPAVAFPVQLARNIQVSADLSILQGSTIRCLMNTRLISDISGQVVCTVTENILSTSAKRVLIPKGTKVVGEYNGKASESLERVGIIWSRLITPNNIDIALESPGTDPLGSAGVPGYVDEKWRLRLGAAVLITLTSDILKVGVQTFAPKTTIARPDPTTGKIAYEEAPFDSATVKMLNKATEPYLNRVLNAPPTILIQQGTLVSIQTAKDMDFSDVYENK
jgi:type IV secretory pathway VirB10-like protein